MDGQIAALLNAPTLVEGDIISKALFLTADFASVSISFFVIKVCDRAYGVRVSCIGSRPTLPVDAVYC